MESSYETFDDADADYPPLCPPPLRHQRSSDLRFDDSPPVYRSLAASSHHASVGSFAEDSYDDEPVYRSMATLSSLDLGVRAVVDDEYDDYGSKMPWGPPQQVASTSVEWKEPPVYRGGHTRASLSALIAAPGEDTTPISLPPPGFTFELPPELLDMVLCLLQPCPDLFAAMLCSRSWRDAAQFNYANRRQTVTAAPDALRRAVDCAWPGDTIVVAAGFHTLSSEISVDKPLRLVAGVGTAVLTSTHHVLLRTRCSALVEGLTLLRLGDEVGYPNAVVYAEAGALTMRDCRITCGGGAPSPAHAMQVFDAVPTAGQPWLGAERPAVVGEEAVPAEDRGQDPQSGLWVGAAARVRLSNSIILCCMGPGIKIYRGELEAEDNTIAFASRGANVVANGGKVVMLRNEIKGALGDGVSSWNNSQLSLDTNRIHANSGAGIAINTGGGTVNITKNHVFDNCCSAVLFATSQTKQATLSENDLERNAAGGVQGLHQVAGHRFLHQQRRRTPQVPHLQRAAFAPPPLLSQPASVAPDAMETEATGSSYSTVPPQGDSMEM